jgi:hypothetical protein
MFPIDSVRFAGLGKPETRGTAVAHYTDWVLLDR